MVKNSLVFTATYNEAGNIAKLLDKILRLNINIDILIIDDNSPDKTFEIIENSIKSSDTGEKQFINLN